MQDPNEENKRTELIDVVDPVSAGVELGGEGILGGVGEVLGQAGEVIGGVLGDLPIDIDI